ncbi:MAG: leucine-rich repeat domain-containing protein [Treponema sp.]|jgi:hypothetical protein|nr:leucine-rich repeat domain-containing protein [Treponema sp.]
MKNTVKFFEAMQSMAIIALVAVIGITVVGCPAGLTDDNENKNGHENENSNIGGKTVIFDSISAMAEWLNSQPTNTATTAYNIKLNVSDLGGDYNASGSAAKAIGNKYVKLDLSGSTITSIGESAFCFTRLTSITIPDSVTSIGDNNVFYGCTSLTTITVDANNSTYSSESGVLYNKNKTTLVSYPGGKQWPFAIPSSVTNIGARAFGDCTNLTAIGIPGSITTISDSAFLGCKGLTNVAIPDSVTKIGNSAFQGCTSLTEVYFFKANIQIADNAFGVLGQPTEYIGDLRIKYLVGGIGKYTRSNGGITWTKVVYGR